MSLRPFDPKVLMLLAAVHGQTRHVSPDSLSRSTRLGRSTIYAWYRELGDRLIHYPQVGVSQLGLTHLHLFVAEAHANLLSAPYAVDRAWTVSTPGTRLLYVHWLVPTAHVKRVRARLPGIVITTGDGWQTLPDLRVAVDGQGRPQVHEYDERPPPGGGETDLARTHPFLIPVIGELLGARRSLAAIWERIYERLGKSVWSYLPSKTRRWSHNGKSYVRQALERLAEYGLIRQHIVRYEPLHEHAIELFLHIATKDDALLRAIGQVAPVMDRYPAGDGYLVRALGDHRLLKALTRTTTTVSWWFVDEERTRAAPNVRFEYETLFDVSSRSWVHT